MAPHLVSFTPWIETEGWEILLDRAVVETELARADVVSGVVSSETESPRVIVDQRIGSGRSKGRVTRNQIGP